MREQSDRKMHLGITLILTIFFATIPIENLLGTSIGSVHKYLGLVLLAVTVVSIVFDRTAILRLKQLAPLFFLALLILLSYLWFPYRIENKYYTTVLFLAIFTFVISQKSLSKSEIEIFRFGVCFVGLIFSLMVLLGSEYTIASKYDGNRLTLGFNGISVDQNNLSVSLAVPVLFCIDALLRNRPRRIILCYFYLITVLLLTSTMLFSGSRGGLLALICAVLAYIWLQNEKRVSIQSIVLLFVCVAVVVVLAIAFLPESILSRFTIEDVVSSGGTGRTDIWKNAIAAFLEEPNLLRQLFGYGFGAFPYWFGSIFGIKVAAHNDLVQMLIDLGFIGLLIYSLIWANLLSSAVKRGVPLQLAVLILVFVGSLSMELLIKKMFWFGIYIYLINWEPPPKEQQ